MKIADETEQLQFFPTGFEARNYPRNTSMTTIVIVDDKKIATFN